MSDLLVNFPKTLPNIVIPLQNMDEKANNELMITELVFMIAAAKEHCYSITMTNDPIQYWENRPFSGVMIDPKRDKTDIKKPIKKKVKRHRTAFTTKQLRALELLFTQNKYITSERRREISKSLNLGDKNVKIWFQNRRMKEKRESSESSPVESDSSNETFACEKSPPATESYIPQQKEIISNEKCMLESCQYQVPQFYSHNEQHFQNVLTSEYNTLQADGMQYYNDNNLYPTQYYPFNDSNYINDYNYYQYQQEQNNYWSSNNFAPCYFYNEGV